MTEPERVDPSLRSCHVPVLVAEVLRYLDPSPGDCIVDGTVGGGGHSAQILERVGSTGRLLGLDRDPTMLARAASVLHSANVSLHQSSYAEIQSVMGHATPPVSPVDGILLDLGLSSDQLADSERGFGFEHDGPLDLRFDPTSGQPAWEWLARVGESELEECLRCWGEEPESRRVAKVLAARHSEPIRTGRELADRVLAATSGRRGRRHPATRVFQALRIAVNEELVHLERALADGLPASLAAGGRLVVISFHSLEDRLVKRAFGDKETWRVLTVKPIRASAREERVNPRSRSARLRAAIRV